MAVSQQMLDTLAATIAEYREGEIDKPSAQHVEKWLAQYDEGVRTQLLPEITHILGQTYIAKKKVEAFLGPKLL